MQRPDLAAPHAPGATPLDPDEIEGLRVGHVRTHAELNALEANNIAGAEAWVAGWRRKREVLTEHFLAELHRRMFGDVWQWAGTYRRTMKSVTPHAAYQVPVLVRDLVSDVAERLRESDGSDARVDDIAMRFHHRLVQIHPWPNGNGRHARFATDLLLVTRGRPRFTWGNGKPRSDVAAIRAEYLTSLRKADGGDFEPLRSFVRS
jgi:Fic-DOC domain mobile mystery protein B